jgi:hypothetical protein
MNGAPCPSGRRRNRGHREVGLDLLVGCHQGSRLSYQDLLGGALAHPLLLVRGHQIVGGLSRTFWGQSPFLRSCTLVYKRIELANGGRLTDSEIFATSRDGARKPN